MNGRFRWVWAALVLALAVVALFVMAVVAMLVFTSAREWWLVLSKRKPATIHETPFVPTTLAVVL